MSKLKIQEIVQPAFSSQGNPLISKDPKTDKTLKKIFTCIQPATVVSLHNDKFKIHRKGQNQKWNHFIKRQFYK